MRLMQTLDRSITAIVTVLLVLAFSIMLGMAALQVFLRFFLHTGLIWGDVAARSLVIWVGFFGAYLATRENKHFRIDVLARLLPSRSRFALTALTDLFAAVVCYYLLQASINFVSIGIDPEAIAFYKIPQSVIAMIVPVGFGLMIVQFLLRTIDSVTHAIQGTQFEEPA
jgi:TRAP-type C4-dicarboxylate transport system permease small subunit